jgi:hypothetical protein
MNISGAWRLGFTGKNIVVTILDDGIEKDHPDLVQNYVCTIHHMCVCVCVCVCVYESLYRCVHTHVCVCVCCMFACARID